MLPNNTWAHSSSRLHDLKSWFRASNPVQHARIELRRYQPIGQPTGREVFPGFVARSVSDPASVLCSAGECAQLWWDARDRIAAAEVAMSFGRRWSANATQPVCA